MVDQSDLVVIHLIEIGDVRGIEELLRQGLDPNKILDKKRCFTTLHFAAGYQSKNQYDIVSVILKYNGNPNYRARDGSTPVHICVLWDHRRILNLLLLHGGNPSQKDFRGKSSLDLAKEESQECLHVILFHSRNYCENSTKLELESTCGTNNVVSYNTDSQFSELESLLSELNVGFCLDHNETDLPISQSISLDSSGTVEYNFHLKSGPSDSSASSAGSLYTTAVIEIKNDSLAVILKSLENLSPCQIKNELLSMGFDPGPITDDLKKNYIKKLAKLKFESGKVKPLANPPIKLLHGYPDELVSILMKKVDSEEMRKLDHELSKDFGRPDPKKKWRDGTRKTCFNYLLLDPEITKKLSSASKINFQEQFARFIQSVFYIGKGQSNRPYEHLNIALKIYRNQSKTPLTKKLNRILSIWRKNMGIICVRCFQNAIPTEALTREACMIDSIALKNLTNEKRGEIYGKAKLWTDKQRRKYGAYLMTRALQVYLNDGERQIRPEDLKD